MSSIDVDQKHTSNRVAHLTRTPGTQTPADDEARTSRATEVSSARNGIRSGRAVKRLPPDRVRAFSWRRLRGPLAAVAVVVAATILSRLNVSIPDAALAYLLLVVVVAAIDGTAPAIFSELIILLSLAISTVPPGHPLPTAQDLVQLTGFAVAATVATLIAGAPRRRTEMLRQALREQHRRLTEAVQSKSEFMDAAAHELRTPLTVISGYASMLQDETFGRLPERFRDPVGAMQRKARELNTLIDEMLLAARVQRGTVPTAAMSIDVRQAVREAVERASPLVTLQQATLNYEVPATPMLTQVDPDHLGHMLDNLITNALTYSDDRPWVKLTVTGGSDVRILVKDRGWGVPEEMRHKIFERFVHYANPAFKPKSGRGLGLAVSRELAERYGGSLDLVRSEPGKGSLFVLRLPAAPA